MDGNLHSNSQPSGKQFDYKKMFQIAGKTPSEIREEIISLQRPLCSKSASTSTITSMLATASDAEISSVCSSASMDKTNVYYSQRSSGNSSPLPRGGAAIVSPTLGDNSKISSTPFSDAATKLKLSQSHLSYKRKKQLSYTPYPKKVHKEKLSGSPSASTSKASSSNRFALLDMEVDLDSDRPVEERSNLSLADAQTDLNDDMETIVSDNEFEQNNSNGKNNPNNNLKPPQIVLSFVNLNDLFDVISGITSLDNVIVKVNQGSTARIFSKDSKTYRDIVDHFDEMEIEFHTYQMKEDKPHRIVVKGLHHSTLTSEIVANFKTLGFEALQVHNPRSRSDPDEKLNIFFINIKPCAKINAIYDIVTLCRQRVRIERMRKRSEIAQCIRCQEFGHTAKYCRRHPNCARCGEDHHTKQCVRPQDQPPTCMHCRGNHTASYKGCQSYQEYLRRSMSSKKQSTRQHPQQKRQQQQPIREQQSQQMPNSSASNNIGLSYASIVRNGIGHAQRRLHDLQAQPQVQNSKNTQQQQYVLDVQSILEQQQQQFMKWQQQLQQQQQQQFFLWLQQQQQEQQKQNKQNSLRLERLENMVFEMANSIKQWTGGKSVLHNNVSASK